jgi:hypothetical protein
MFYALRGAQVIFETGFTTIRKHGHSKSHASRSETYEVAIRGASNAGLYPSPHILTGGYFHITRGHLDLVTPRAAHFSLVEF